MSSVSDPTPLHAAQAPAEPAAAGHGHGGHHGLAHISPWQTLVKVWVVLMLLTILTVMATWVDLGTLNIWIAMGIAVAKASLVVLYFMHLKYDSPFNGYIFTFSLAFVAVFLGFVILDSKSYRHTVEKRYLDEVQLPAEPAPVPPGGGPPPGAATNAPAAAPESKTGPHTR
jgi:cytochrome c oxidase subunit 4